MVKDPETGYQPRWLGAIQKLFASKDNVTCLAGIGAPLPHI